MNELELTKMLFVYEQTVGAFESENVLDPFIGSGTTGMMAIQNNRNFIGFELNPEYVDIANKYRLNQVQLKIV